MNTRSRSTERRGMSRTKGLIAVPRQRLGQTMRRSDSGSAGCQFRNGRAAPAPISRFSASPLLRAACRIRWRGGAGHFDPEYLADFRAVEHNGTALDFGLGCRRWQLGQIQHQRHRIDRGFDKAVLHIEVLRGLRDRMTDQRSRSQLPCDCERAKKSVL